MAEGDIGLEVAGETGRVGEVEAVAAGQYVFVEGVFVVGFAEQCAVVKLKHAAKLAHGLRRMGVSEGQLHLPLAVELERQATVVV